MKIDMKEEIANLEKEHSQWNEIFRFRIARTQCAYLRAKHANPLIFMVFGRKVEAGIVGDHKNWHEEVDGRGRKNDIFRFGSWAHSPRICSQEARKSTHIMVCGEKRQLELV